MTDEQLAQIVARLDQRLGISTLWLFGSEARGTATARSDLDLAALFVRPQDSLALLEARDDLALLLGRDVDLVDLGRASPALAMQVLRHGRLVVDRHPSLRVRFTAALPSRYEDLRLVRAPIERRILERAHGRT